jgi:hypothetical protein
MGVLNVSMTVKKPKMTQYMSLRQQLTKGTDLARTHARTHAHTRAPIPASSTSITATHHCLSSSSVCVSSARKDAYAGYANPTKLLHAGTSRCTRHQSTDASACTRAVATPDEPTARRACHRGSRGGQEDHYRKRKGTNGRREMGRKKTAASTRAVPPHGPQHEQLHTAHTPSNLTNSSPRK